jgi:hypothetical protein
MDISTTKFSIKILVDFIYHEVNIPKTVSEVAHRMRGVRAAHKNKLARPIVHLRCLTTLSW